LQTRAWLFHARLAITLLKDNRVNETIMFVKQK